MNDTKGWIIGAVVITSATTFVRQAGTGTITFRSYLASSFMGIALTGIGMASPELAKNLAVLIILSVLVKDAGAIFTSTSKIVGAPPINFKGNTPPHAQR